jgi:hypothetical protein
MELVRGSLERDHEETQEEAGTQTENERERELPWARTRPTMKIGRRTNVHTSSQPPAHNRILLYLFNSSDLSVSLSLSLVLSSFFGCSKSVVSSAQVLLKQLRSLAHLDATNLAQQTKTSTKKKKGTYSAKDCEQQKSP